MTALYKSYIYHYDFISKWMINFISMQGEEFHFYYILPLSIFDCLLRPHGLAQYGFSVSKQASI